MADGSVQKLTEQGWAPMCISKTQEKNFKDWGYRSVTESLPSMHMALGLILSTTHKKEKKEKKTRQGWKEREREKLLLF